MKKLILLGFAFLLVIAEIVNSQIPKKITYQGVLKLVSDVIVPDGEYALTFKIYDVATGGDSLWSETQTTSVKGGILDVILGSVNPIVLGFDKPYWLGVTVETFPELTPRIQLTTAPYSFRAQVADTALIALASGDSCLWETDGSDVYRFTGKVGIGTTEIGTPDPNARLHVKGGNIVVSDSTDIPDLTLAAINPVHAGDIRTNVDGSNISRIRMDLDGDGAVWSFRDNIRDDVSLYISGLGKVGIGTNEPSEKLDVDGTAQMTGFKMTSGASDGDVLTSDAGGTGTWQPPVGGMKTGTFTGDGNATQVITGLGFQPRCLIVYGVTYQAHKWMKSNQDIGGQCQVLDTIEIQSDVIISLDPDGFTVGDFETMNTLGETYAYIAFR